MNEFWNSYVGDVIDIFNQIQTKAEFSCAMAVLDEVGGWKKAKKRRFQHQATKKLVEHRRQVCGFTPKLQFAMAESAWMSSGTRRGTL